MLLRTLARHRMAVQVAGDSVAWVLALGLANALRFDFALTDWCPPGLVTLTLVAVTGQLMLGSLLHLYRGRYRFGSFEEVAAVFVTVTTAAVVVEVIDLAAPGTPLLPRSVPVAAGAFALMLMLGLRYAWRLSLERHRRPAPANLQPLLVFGAGEGADQVIAAMLRDPQSPFYPVGVLDDDPRKSNLRIRGVRVLGGRDALGAVVASTGARTLLLAVPSASGDFVRELRDLATLHGLALKVLPALADLVDGKVRVGDIRDLDLADLMGRRQIDLDLGEIAGYLTGKRVLVTGAGGSIGSELCRQLVQFAPAELIMLDRDESALHAVQLSLTGRAMLDGDDLVLADIRDIAHIQQIFETRRPEVVFHAAALKHLTLLERHPGEAVKSNVWGTLAVLDAALAVGVERFVNISTDKAADPESVLGYSKRITERLTAYVARDAAGSFMSVRFGNVLGSRGSVLTTFVSQIASGGPITVTHPEVTRFFMTIQEAVQLTIQAGAVGNPGEALVLDMGAPVAIADVARQMAAGAPGAIEIVYTGLRPGEKLHEDLLSVDEVDVRPRHPLISQVAVPPLSPEAAWALDPWGGADEVLQHLQALCGGVKTLPLTAVIA